MADRLVRGLILLHQLVAGQVLVFRMLLDELLIGDLFGVVPAGHRIGTACDVLANTNALIEVVFHRVGRSHIVGLCACGRGLNEADLEFQQAGGHATLVGFAVDLLPGLEAGDPLSSTVLLLALP